MSELSIEIELPLCWRLENELPKRAVLTLDTEASMLRDELLRFREAVCRLERLIVLLPEPEPLPDPLPCIAEMLALIAFKAASRLDDEREKLFDEALSCVTSEPNESNRESSEDDVFERPWLLETQTLLLACKLLDQSISDAISSDRLEITRFMSSIRVSA